MGCWLHRAPWIPKLFTQLFTWANTGIGDIDILSWLKSRESDQIFSHVKIRTCSPILSTNTSPPGPSKKLVEPDGPLLGWS